MGDAVGGDLELRGSAKKVPLKHRQWDVTGLHSSDNFWWHRGLDTGLLLECRANTQLWLWGGLFRNILFMP